MKSITNGLFWKLMERISIQGISFVLQLFLARLLDPAHYGALSIMVIFVNLANVFIQNGFNMALIQNKETDDEDFSSVFWVTLGVSALLFILLYISIPSISAYYQMPDIVWPFRVLIIMLFPGALNSIQIAKVSREMDFKKVFTSSISGTVISGAVGIILAFCGAGLWALVAQSLLSTAMPCLVMWMTVRWRPKFVCNIQRVKVLFAFGWKILVSGLLNAFYEDISSLVIGKKYNASMLGYYNRGKQFPQTLIKSINGTVQSVMLPAMSQKQDDPAQVKKLMRKSITLSSFILFSMMAGLAGIAEPLVELLLTEKWMPCVPFLKVHCLVLAFYPIHSCNLQAINAMGRSDIFLKLEVIKKVIGILALIVAVFCFDSAMAIAMTGVFTTFTSSFVNAYPNKKLIQYSYIEQLKDIMPSLAIASAMYVVVWLIHTLGFAPVITLLIQIPVGVLFYILLSKVFKIEALSDTIDIVKRMLKQT